NFRGERSGAMSEKNLGSGDILSRGQTVELPPRLRSGLRQEPTGRTRASAPTCSAAVPTSVVLEPERYELAAAAPYRFDLGRREFFKFLGAGVLVVSVLKPAVDAQESSAARRRGGDESLLKEIDAWLH